MGDNGLNWNQFGLQQVGQYIGERFNYLRLDTIMLTTPIAWQGNVEQYAGRLHRDFEGKQDVIVYDYVDLHIWVLERTNKNIIISSPGINEMKVKRIIALMRERQESGVSVAVITLKAESYPENRMEKTRQLIN